VTKRTFSEKYGFSQTSAEIQTEDLNKATRCRIWNYVVSFFEELEGTFDSAKIYKPFVRAYFDEILKVDASKIHNGNAKSHFEDLSSDVYGNEWHSVYDLLQFIADYCTQLNSRHYQVLFIAGCNAVLKSEMAGYIFVGGDLCPITEDGEVAEIELALKDESSEVKQHLKSSLRLLSDRKNPDFRNSVKESISALESALRKATGEKTLGKALNSLPSSTGIRFNQQLKSGLTSLYAWTNGEDGIRHALMTDSNVSREDAKLMLIINSAILNYIRVTFNKI